MKKYRWLIGVSLILLSLAAVFFWESRGREAFLYTEVPVAAAEIPAGTVCSPSLFVMQALPGEACWEKALSASELAQLAGQISLRSIPAGSQILKEDFGEKRLQLGEGQSVYLIKKEWIFSRSSALRRGDLVEITGRGDGASLGCFRLAFVKTDEEKEVVSPEGADGLMLDRSDGDGVISQVEIIATQEEYRRIEARADGQEEAGLIIVYKEE